LAIDTLILTTETKADVAQKQSWISVSVVVTGGSGTISGGAVSLKGPTDSAYTQIGTMNGVSVSADTATTVFSYSGVVAHQDTGGGTVSIQTAAYTLGGVSVASKTATYTLQQIPIPNTLTFGTLTAGTNAIIMIARGKSTYNSTITATANGQTLSILSNSNRSATVYTFAKSLFNDGVYMARKEMPITISIKTTDTANNNMVIGTRRYNTTLYFPDSPPVLSGMTFTYAYASNPPGQSYINAETLTGKFYNNGLTNLQISGSVTPDNSRIKTITLDGDFGSHLLYDSSTAPPVGGDGTININTVVERLYGNNGSNTATLRVTDLRGAVSTATTTQTFYVAQAPSLSNASLTRGTYSGGTFTVDDEGTAIRYTATLSSETTFGILSFYNAGQYIGESQYATGSVTYYFTGVDPTVNSELRVDVHNWLSQASYIYIAPLSMPDFNYNPSLHGIAFGKQAATANSVENEWRLIQKGQVWLYNDIIFDDLAQTTQRNIRFANASSSTNHHDIVLFGGNPSSANAFGIYDNINSRFLLKYSGGKLEYCKDGDLTMTRTNNSYVDATSFGRMTARRRSNILFLQGNLSVSNLPSNSTSYQIGTISGWNATDNVYLDIPCQTGTGVLLLTVTSAGVISILNASGSTINGFCRFQIAIPTSD
jgi:hypothetical protein